MKDETAAKAEQMAQMVATCVRLTQLLNITMDDAVVLMGKFADAAAHSQALKRLTQ